MIGSIRSILRNRAISGDPTDPMTKIIPATKSTVRRENAVNARAPLRQALMLGLCTAQMYDPARPVMWTETSLTRAVELYDSGSFYA